RNLPSWLRTPSDTTTVHQPTRSTVALTRARKAASSNGISGNRMMGGASSGELPARPAAAAIHPAWRPITCMTNTLVEDSAIEATSRLASRTDTAVYFATDPNPGQQSVTARSLSTVFGTPTTVTSWPSALPVCALLLAGSADSVPP